MIQAINEIPIIIMNLPHLIYCMSLLDWIQIIFIVSFDERGGVNIVGDWMLFSDTKTLFPNLFYVPHGYC